MVGVRRAEIIGVLTAATELALGFPSGTLLRGTLLSVAFARRLGWSAAELATVYWYSLIRYSGCHADNHGFSALIGDEIALNRIYGVIDSANPDELLPAMIALGRPRAAAAAGGRSARSAGAAGVSLP